jgi:uncharacterized protein YqjF (DUF2071 family)
MQIASKLLEYTNHRPFPLPTKPWKYYQEWSGTIFLHYKIPQDILEELLPPGLVLDTFNGEAWVSVVAFSVNNMRLKYMPPLPLVSNFHEFNIRTYVIKDGIPGIYFISVQASNLLSAYMARLLVGIKYKKAKINRKTGEYILSKPGEGNAYHTKYMSLQNINDKQNIDHWLTERYCAYEPIEETMYRYNIHHKPWPLKKIKLRKVKVHYDTGNLKLADYTPALKHYAPNQKVLLWGREKC